MTFGKDGVKLELSDEDIFPVSEQIWILIWCHKTKEEKEDLSNIRIFSSFWETKKPTNIKSCVI